jgi:hypothetical protein
MSEDNLDNCPKIPETEFTKIKTLDVAAIFLEYPISSDLTMVKEKFRRQCLPILIKNRFHRLKILPSKEFRYF